MEAAEFIFKMNELYRPPLNAGQQKLYQQMLNYYTPMQLDELWRITMETHASNSPPAIGRLREYAKDVTKVAVITPEQKKKEEIKQLAEEGVFSTTLGKLALRQGWAHSYLIHCRRSGIPEQNDKMILWFQKAQHNAETAYKELEESHEGFLHESLMRLRQSMRQKNRDLCEEYKHLWKIK